MRQFSQAVLAALGAGLVTFLLGQVSGLNAWVLQRIQGTWNIPGYLVVFPFLLFVGVVSLFLLDEKTHLRPTSTIALGATIGYLAGVASYLLAPLVSGAFDLRQYWAASTFDGIGGFIGFLGLSLLIPLMLLGWLYGGVIAALGLLGRRLLSRHRS